MGAGIAAQVANSGTPVLLLDIVKPGQNDRDAVAKGAVATMLKTEPAPFMSKAAAKLVETGNIEDHLDKVAECDWVVEAIIERLDLKQALYQRLDKVRRPGTAISSQHLHHPAGQPDRGHVGGVQARLPDHPLVQPAALHAPAGGRHLSRHRCGARRQGRGLLRPEARQDGGPGQGHAGLHRQPHRHLLDAAGGGPGHGGRADHRGGRRGDGQAAGLPLHRRVRPAWTWWVST